VPRCERRRPMAASGYGSRLNRMDWGSVESVESSYELSLGALPQD
jgi:hypothetical protein